MTDYQEPSGNLRGLFILLKTYQKPAGNLPETSAAGFWRFPEVSGQSVIDGPHGIQYTKRNRHKERGKYFMFFQDIAISVTYNKGLSQ